MNILCFGDSNTYGYDPRSFFGDRYSACWVDLLGAQTVNAGENGRRIPTREAELSRFLRLLDRHRPVDLVIVMLGTNDLLQGSTPEAALAMEHFLKQISLAPARILLTAPPPMKPGAWVPSSELVEASGELAGAYEAVAARLGVGFVDAGAWGIPLAYDGVHFTEAGHEIFAGKMKERIEKLHEQHQ